MTKCIKANVSVLATLAGVVEQTGIHTMAPVNKSKSFTVLTTKNSIQIILGGNQLSGIVEIYDSKGRLVYKNHIGENNRNGVNINSGTFASGIYHAQLRIGKTSTSTVLVISR